MTLSANIPTAMITTRQVEQKETAGLVARRFPYCLLQGLYVYIKSRV